MKAQALKGKTHNYMDFNKLARIFLVCLSVGFLGSCNDEHGQTTAWTDATVATAVPIPVSSPSAKSTAASTTVTDLNARSESKGIGKFTSVKLGEIDQSMALKGKSIFAAKCSACHQLTDQKIVGPGLAGVTKRRTPEWIMNQITNPEVMAQKDPVGKALLAKHLIQMTNQNVSDEETRQILEYLRQNDK